jgi:hypothetical protein
VEFLRVASGDAALPEHILTGDNHLLPERGAALARFATDLTARPWSVSPDHTALLASHGVDGAALESAIGVVAMFNYLTRVADASGIELDYASPLPAFQPRRDREPAPRPDRGAWPVVADEFRTLPSYPATTEAWQRWHEYVFDSDEPLTRRERRLLASAAAQETCDRARADELADHTPRDEREALLDTFARKLSRTPWRMTPSDLRALRDAGHPEPALLHAISVVALQNAESRLAMGRALTAR